MIGKSIAHFEITAKIGEGGMGEVYQATDTKLSREVALKILPQIFAQDAQRMGRFQREAQVLASLNHPNIAAIYGLETRDPGPGAAAESCLVMELVEGEDLSERIAHGPIPLDEALPIALQIAEALEDAHEKGIVHRDLKPANVKLTPEGKVKVLDFGLAKALEEAPEIKSNATHSPTLTMQATQAGIILGTAAYMSPEQAKGTAVDRRADIWAYGTVLYEMLTGERAFKGEDITEVMAHVITQAIEIDRFADKVPKDIRKLIGRCLERNLRRRLSSISEARIILEDHISESVEAAEPEPELTPKTQPLWKRLAPGAVAAVLAIAVIMTLMGVLVRTPQPEPPPLMRIAMVLPSSQQLSGTGRHVIATSPGGTHLVYSANNQLYLRPMDQLEATPINGTEGARSPFFSPDGQWVGFWARGELKKVSIAGGTPMTLCETGNP